MLKLSTSRSRHRVATSSQAGCGSITRIQLTHQFFASPGMYTEVLEDIHFARPRKIC